ncbi:MAG: SDR family NAD(P)-dependent oxidoreductase [Alphaproteobacteria bacterium]
MRVFVTGATGYIGSAVVRALVESGNTVLGLARTPDKATTARALGAEPVQGDMMDASSFEQAASGCDTLIHLAADMGMEMAASDRAAVDNLVRIASARQGNTTLIYTSGVMVLGDTGDNPVDENTTAEHPAALVAWRPGHEEIVLNAASATLTTAVIRPGMVYGGNGGLIAQYFDSAVNTGAVAYIGDGQNRWGLIHRDDLAQLYRRVIEQRAGGIFHGVDGHALKVVDVAKAASAAAGAGGAVTSIPLAKAHEQMGPFADALCLDQVVLASRSAQLGWRAQHGSFTENAAAAYEEWAG